MQEGNWCVKGKILYLMHPSDPLSFQNQHSIFRSAIDDLGKSRFAPFCSTGDDFSFPAIRNEFGHFQPHPRLAREAHQPFDGLFASPSIICIQHLLMEKIRI